MIQELFAGSNLIAGERKISINSPSSSSSLLLPPTTTSSTLTTTTTPTSTTNNSSSSSDQSQSQNQNQNQNLRCPRCDSSNTKFCYYNNYNLTQPRHFCKTCRRYWTKGGALRNVPIGGGCRKNKNVGMSSASAASKATTATKMKAVVASELGRSGLASGFDHELQIQPSPILWGSPQNTHVLALLRAAQNQNPNPNPNSGPMSVKEEGNLMGSNNHQSHMVAEPLIANGLLNMPRSTLGYDGGVGQVVPSLGLCGSSLWRNNGNTHHQDQQQQNSGGFVLGENHQSSGIQELYHKIRATSTNNNNNNYCNENSSSSPIMFMGNMASSSSSSSSSLSTILESSSVVGGSEFMGCWNPTLPWSDLPTTTTNGAYP